MTHEEQVRLLNANSQEQSALLIEMEAAQAEGDYEELSRLTTVLQHLSSVYAELLATPTEG